ncbi:MAG: hypothetical protein IKW96_07730 [Ruminococcus sp.]|uniref:hypothetical protein n=1 Tax=Ruminococcus sp. TaxID=41978 RepID=UPI0025E3DAFD|nr:hypothetical protein [Ruminococcus sp.]MBR5683155.1 hypothetical protein [Ruminococcus sp.]
MFKEAGKKLKLAAKILFWVIAVIGTIEGLVLVSKTTFWAVLLIPLSIGLGYVSSLALYAFGDMCENIDLIRSNFYTVTTIMEKRFPDLAESDIEDDDNQ